MTKAGDIDLAALLWYARRIRGTGADSLGRSWVSSAAPSAGGVGEIDIILDSGVEAPWRYDPLRHTAESLVVADLNALHRARRVISEFIPEANATVLYLFGDSLAISARYEDSASLLWRDAGALLGVLALVATCLKLAFCPLGSLGFPMADALHQALPAHVPVGVALVGYPAQ